MRVGPDPRVFVGESPGLNRGAAWILQACPDHSAIDLSLMKKIVVPGHATGVNREGYIEFGDVNLQTQRGQARDVSGDGCGGEIKLRNMHLQADSVDSDPAVLEILHHGVDGIGFAIEAFATVFVIEEQRLWVGVMRPAKGLLDVGRALVRQSDAGLVVPGESLTRPFSSSASFTTSQAKTWPA